MVSEKLDGAEEWEHTKLKGVDGFGINIGGVGLAGEFGCECHCGRIERRLAGC